MYGTPRNLFGEENLAYLYYDDPELLHDIQRHWLKFYGELTTEVITHLRVDYILFWEDMSYKNGPLISPTLFKEFISPYYREIISHLRHLGLSIFMVDSDGNNDPIMDFFMEAGINIMMPFEVAANQCPLKTRKKYGHKLAIIGGLDKRALIKSKSEIEKEVATKVPFLLKSGGYIPSIDHTVPPDISLENFQYFIRLIRSCYK